MLVLVLGCGGQRSTEGPAVATAMGGTGGGAGRAAGGSSGGGAGGAASAAHGSGGSSGDGGRVTAPDAGDAGEVPDGLGGPGDTIDAAAGDTDSASNAEAGDVPADVGVVAPPQACTDPRFPKRCPGGGGLPGGCANADADCNTGALCGKVAVFCPAGARVSCQTENACVPATNACPLAGAPTATKFCPARGRFGATCVAPDQDCSTVDVCEDGTVMACKAGQVPSCIERRCKPIDKTCAADYPEYPVTCGKGDDAACLSPEQDCATRTRCGEDEYFCSRGERFDCKTKICVSIDGTCKEPGAPKACKAPDGSVVCLDASYDCADVGVCQGETIVCFPGYSLDCGTPLGCAPKNQDCSGDRLRPKYCPGRGGSGAHCWSAAVDCNTVVICADGDVHACATGQHYDCVQRKCVK